MTQRVNKLDREKKGKKKKKSCIRDHIRICWSLRHTHGISRYYNNNNNDYANGNEFRLGDKMLERISITLKIATDLLVLVVVVVVVFGAFVLALALCLTHWPMHIISGL